eukprot:SAG31_NODE_301_length_18103_cov_13.772551_16_plen_74_part_00
MDGQPEPAPEPSPAERLAAAVTDGGDVAAVAAEVTADIDSAAAISLLLTGFAAGGEGCYFLVLLCNYSRNTGL